MNLPPDVQRVKKVLAQNPKNELHKIAKALISDDPDLVKMWKSISRAVKQRAEKSFASDSLLRKSSLTEEKELPFLFKKVFQVSLIPKYLAFVT